MAWYQYSITDDTGSSIDEYLALALDDGNITYKIEKRSNDQYWREYAYENEEWIATGMIYSSNPFLSKTNNIAQEIQTSSALKSPVSTNLKNLPFGLSNIINEKALKEYLEDLFRQSTVNGQVNPELARLLGASKDKNGIYHIDQKSWQSWGFVGYNDFYDWVFDVTTPMNSKPFPFTYKGENVVLWAWWKGDYINLGAGAEMGIYYQTEEMIDFNLTNHWLSGTKYKLPMTLRLYQNGTQLFYWEPGPKQWWINGFDPKKMSPVAEKLEADYWINFSGNTGLFDAFYKKYYNTNPNLTFDPDKHTVIYKFKGDGK